MKLLAICFTAASLALGACSAAQSPDIAAEASTAKPAAIGAYMIVRGKNYDAKALAPYSASLPPIYEKYGGYYVGFSTDFVTLEGADPSDVILMSAWPSVEAAETFWASPEYAKSIKMREGNGEFTVIILPAIPKG